MCKNSIELPTAKVWAGGRVVGLVSDGVFYKRIKTNHMLTRPHAIAFDLQSLADAEEAGATKACITNTDTSQVFRADIATIRRRGLPVNRGHGAQIALELKHWQVDGDHEEEIPQAANEAVQFAAEIPAVEQLSLLAEVEP